MLWWCVFRSFPHFPSDDFAQVFTLFATANTVNEHLAVHNVLKEQLPILEAEERQASLSISELYRALTAHQSEVEYWRDANQKLDDGVVSLKATVVKVKVNSSLRVYHDSL